MATISNFQATTEAEHPQVVMTKKSQRWHMVKVLIIVLIATATAVFTVLDVGYTAENLAKRQKLSRNIFYSIETASVIHSLQKERGLFALFLVSKLWDTTVHMKKLQEFRDQTDESIMAFRDWSSTKINGTMMADSFTFLKLLQSFRSKIDNEGQEVEVTEHIQTYSTWINGLMSRLPQYTASQALEHHAEDVFAYQLLIYSKEEASLEKALGGIYFLEGKNFTALNISWYNEKRIRSKTFMETAFSFSSEVKTKYFSLFEDEQTNAWMVKLETQRKMLASNNVTNPSKYAALQWVNLTTKYGDLMLKVQIEYGNRIQDHVDTIVRSNIKWLIIRSFLVVFALIVVPCIISSLVRVHKAFYKYTLSLYGRVGLEQGRTEFLMRENARHVQDLALRWKQFSKETTPDGENAFRNGTVLHVTP